jgi:hypothetical protein
MRPHYPLYAYVNFWLVELILKKVSVYIMAAEPISKGRFINDSQQFLCLQVYPPYSC